MRSEPLRWRHQYLYKLGFIVEPPYSRQPVAASRHRMSLWMRVSVLEKDSMKNSSPGRSFSRVDFAPLAKGAKAKLTIRYSDRTQAKSRWKLHNEAPLAEIRPPGASLTSNWKYILIWSAMVKKDSQILYFKNDQYEKSFEKLISSWKFSIWFCACPFLHPFCLPFQQRLTLARRDPQPDRMEKAVTRTPPTGNVHNTKIKTETYENLWKHMENMKI